MNPKTKSFQRILNGARYFRNHTHAANRKAYEKAARIPQRPDTLFLTCADSRIDPELLTDSGPGQIFVARNVGNMVPPYGQFIGGVSAIIEYAVLALEVQQIIICGHEDCGAMKGLLDPTLTQSMTSVREWLYHGHAALSIVEAPSAKKRTKNEILNSLIEQNVLMQMSHLRTHPSVAGRFAQRKLDVYGWVYNISSGEIRMYDEEKRNFFAINSDA